MAWIRFPRQVLAQGRLACHDSADATCTRPRPLDQGVIAWKMDRSSEPSSLEGLLFLGGLIAFGGPRLFLILLPIYGFFFGLSFGTHSVQALFGNGFLSTTTSSVIRFFAGLCSLLLSYLFWAFAVALMAGSLGYGPGGGLLRSVRCRPGRAGLDRGRRGRRPVRDLCDRPEPSEGDRDRLNRADRRVGRSWDVPVPLHVRRAREPRRKRAKTVLNEHPLWLIIFAVVAAVGMLFQFQVNRSCEIERCDRWEVSAAGMHGTPPPAAM